MRKSNSYFARFVLILSLLIFLILAGIYLKTGFFKFDYSASNFFISRRDPSLNKVFTLITITGNVFSIVVFSLAAILFLYLHGMKRDAAFFGANILGVWLFNEFLKILFKRQRPSVLRLVNASGYSFPSGHAMIFIGFAIIVIYYLSCLIRSKQLVFIISLFILVYSILVGISRVYLGVHYPSDVLAGWSAGTMWSLSTIIIYRLKNKKNLSL